MLMSAIGTKRTSPSALHMSAFDPKRTSHAVRPEPKGGPFPLLVLFYVYALSGNTVAPKVCGKIAPSDAGFATIKT